MCRRIVVALLLGALALSACSDQSHDPTEPSAAKKPPLPVCSTQGWLNDVKTRNALVFSGSLLSSANEKVTAINTKCKSGAQADARKKAIFFVDWMFKKYRARQTKSSARAVDLAALTSAVLSGVGLQTGGISPEIFGPTGGVGGFDNTQVEPTTVTTVNQNAGVQLPGTGENGTPAYAEPTLIVIIQLPDSPQLTGEGAPPADEQFPPNYDINAINASGTHDFQAGAPDGVVSICFRPDIAYPDDVVIGHTTFAGIFEFLPPADPIAEVTCGTPPPVIGAALPPGLPGLALSAWRTVTRRVGPAARAILLPEALEAAVRSGVASGSARTLSPFGIVEAPAETDVAFASTSAGIYHTCAATTTGDAYCWGKNLFGQLGNGPSGDSNVPVAVSGEHSFASVTAGNDFSCGVTTAGSAYCWGRNLDGELGNGANTSSSVPVAVSGSHVFSSVSAGTTHACGVSTSGAAYCWGNNPFGQLGDGTTTSSNVPVAVSGELTFASVSAGNAHTCGVTTSGFAYCWGYNGARQLGDGTTTNRSTPVAVSGELTFASVSAGNLQTCGLTPAGLAYCWGDNALGQLGDGTNTNSSLPVAVSGEHVFASLSALNDHGCGVTAAGAGYCWGYNGFGELGNGGNSDSNVPVAVSGTLNLAGISAGGFHTCGQTAGGTAWCWGYNLPGQLGNGSNTDSNVPVAVTSP